MPNIQSARKKAKLNFIDNDGTSRRIMMRRPVMPNDPSSMVMAISVEIPRCWPRIQQAWAIRDARNQLYRRLAEERNKINGLVKFIGGSMDGKVLDIPTGARTFQTPTETYAITVMAGRIKKGEYTGNWLAAHLVAVNGVSISTGIPLTTVT